MYERSSHRAHNQWMNVRCELEPHQMFYWGWNVPFFSLCWLVPWTNSNLIDIRHITYSTIKLNYTSINYVYTYNRNIKAHTLNYYQYNQIHSMNNAGKKCFYKQHNLLTLININAILTKVYSICTYNIYITYTANHLSLVHYKCTLRTSIN